MLEATAWRRRSATTAGPGAELRATAMSLPRGSRHADPAVRGPRARVPADHVPGNARVARIRRVRASRRVAAGRQAIRCAKVRLLRAGRAAHVATDVDRASAEVAASRGAVGVAAEAV